MPDPLRLSYGQILPGALREVIGRLHDAYGPNLVVRDLDARGATIEVRGLTGEVLIRQLMARKPEFFGAEVPAGGNCVLGPGAFQVLAPLAAGVTTGVFLRFLGATPPGETLSGFWYY